MKKLFPKKVQKKKPSTNNPLLNENQCLIYLENLKFFPVLMSIDSGEAKFEYEPSKKYSDDEINAELKNFMDKILNEKD